MQQFLLDVTASINDFFWSYVLIVMLVVLGLFFSFKGRFLQVRMIKDMLQAIREGKKGSADSISPFQAFCISMAARVGTGNITGIAIAVALGGPGAVFWMWVIAIIGSASAFVESTLAQVYKIKDKDGFRGGPAYYMEKGLNKRWMGALFAVLITLSFGLVFNAVQSNTITLAFENSFGTDRLTIGLIMTIAFAAIIFGGVKRIAKMSEYIVIVLAILYIGVALFIVMMNITKMPEMIALIVKSAFGLEQVAGGTLGAALMHGVKRGLFSNEAGMGSAPNAAATATTSHPVKQGLIQAFGVLTDTLIICTSTAFIILLSGAYKQSDLSGIELSQAALSIHLGDWASATLAVMVFLFAFSTLIGNYYYGETNIEFLKTSKLWLMLYRVSVLAMVLFGAVAKVQLVWDLADLFMGLMVVVNLIAIFMLSKVAFAALRDYQEQKKAGKDPVFYKDSIPGLENADAWEAAPVAKKNEHAS
ncbi:MULTISPECIES: alanine/glycine:cation symporter family protein [Brevibacillus]|jgi:amino acid carrier protein|uniref:Sodium:alanine symporter n=1 Tax=Brevibacillus parabrevis TaxID=54914 RepID=A0A4Y3PWH0_BREPA|nr:MULTISPECIES: alanine/glycine:cation symporter family protein [Brevibacillus]MBU8711072.1 alanine:cation symporter family protein [Brevibacillus parabrevis]MDH6353230.1 putative sodium/glutamine symporter [Brevibacillus sp. 1238]MDR5002719.1 alanine/glycine:cation symporter family protein [Brevibacillus parabrevis]MED2253743.1 alanine/glycine:cation symporter family protein [Brevibacillus parabrevis]NRQ56737.1 alanine:cation symporter family protein [Brevibacillus sp. HD1.4A]